jgi:hypothetical protein
MFHRGTESAQNVTDQIVSQRSFELAILQRLRNRERFRMTYPDRQDSITILQYNDRMFLLVERDSGYLHLDHCLPSFVDLIIQWNPDKRKHFRESYHGCDLAARYAKLLKSGGAMLRRIPSVQVWLREPTNISPTIVGRPEGLLAEMPRISTKPRESA